MDNKDVEIIKIDPVQVGEQKPAKQIGTSTHKKENVKYIGNKIFENKTITFKRKNAVSLGFKLMSYAGLSYLICLVLFPITVNLENTFLKILLQIVCLLICFACFYIPMWYEGKRDYALVKQKKLKFDQNRAAISGVICILSYMVSYSFLLFGKIFNVQALFNIYKILNVQFAALHSLIFPTPYVTNVSISSSIILFLLPFVFVLCMIFGYDMGYKQSKLLSGDLFKKKVDVENL